MTESTKDCSSRSTSLSRRESIWLGNAIYYVSCHSEPIGYAMVDFFVWILQNNKLRRFGSVQRDIAKKSGFSLQTVSSALGVLKRGGFVGKDLETNQYIIVYDEREE